MEHIYCVVAVFVEGSQTRVNHVSKENRSPTTATAQQVASYKSRIQNMAKEEEQQQPSSSSVEVIALKDRHDDDDNSSKSSSSSDSFSSSSYAPLLSHLLFLLASILYTYLATLSWAYEHKVKDLPVEVLDTDDDGAWSYWGYTDDYLFALPNTVKEDEEGIWISKYQLVYLFAALGFVLSGVVDWTMDKSWYSCLMIVAAGFGVASAVVLEYFPVISNYLNMVSVHLWLLEAFTITSLHGRSGMSSLVRLGDGCFLVGTLMDVVLSWVLIRRHRYRAGTLLALFEMVAACFWLLAALVYVATTLQRRRQQSIELDSGITKNPSKVTVVEVNSENDEGLMGQKQPQSWDESTV